jgi:hypothetical protein
VSTVTPRLNLVKPTTLEQYALSVVNNNMDLIDANTVMQSEWKPNWTDLPTLGTGWSAYIGGGGYYSGIRYRRTGDMLQVQGMIRNGAAGSTMFTLPLGWRPQYTVIAPTEANAAGTMAMLLWNIDGTVGYRSGPTAPAYVNVYANLPLAP